MVSVNDEELKELSRDTFGEDDPIKILPSEIQEIVASFKPGKTRDELAAHFVVCALWGFAKAYSKGYKEGVENTIADFLKSMEAQGMGVRVVKVGSDQSKSDRLEVAVNTKVN